VEHYGIILGVAWLGLVLACAVLLGRKAARSVEQFREDQHESFLRKERQ